VRSRAIAIGSTRSTSDRLPRRLDAVDRRADALAAREQGADCETGDQGFFPTARRALVASDLDDVFTDLLRDSQGRATVAVSGKSQRLEIRLGPSYQAVTI
jgi:hypothetical protein